MGYESRVYICKKHNWSEGGAYFSTLYGANLSKMDYDFPELFTTPMGKGDDWYGIDWGEPIYEDPYGDPPMYCDFMDVLSYFYERDCLQRRELIFRDLLQSFYTHMDDWENEELVVVHTGY